MPEQTIAVLFARSDSVYKSMPNCDVYDKARNALSWPGGTPVIAHPPCAQWGRLYKFARKIPEEKAYAPWAVEQVRRFGGVVEHPLTSRLWAECNIPRGSERDSYGGFSIFVAQWWFGHVAEKATLLYVVGCEPAQLPLVPFKLGEADKVVSTTRRRNGRPEMLKSKRDATPPAFAAWLYQVASSCRRPVYLP